MSKSYKFKRFLTRRYQILATILILLAGGLVLLPKYQKNEGISPELFVKNAIVPERYISTDGLSERLVNEDPSVLLIDIRSEKEYNEFTLPNAVNIPLEKFLEEDSGGYLDQDIYDVVLFSNDNFYADQAWMIGNRLGYTNLHVLKGGLNEWFNTIINPQYPDETMPKEEFSLYSLRKGAGMYFGVGSIIIQKESKNKKVVSQVKTTKKTTPKKVVPVKKKKKAAPEGGC